MSDSDSSEKTEEPTGRRLQSARDDGQVPRSTEMPAAAVTIAATAVLVGLGGWLLHRLSRLFAQGLSFDRNGQLTLDEAKLDKALQNNFDEVVKTFSAGTNSKSIYSTAPSGIAGDAVIKLDQMLRSSGLIANQTDSANKKIDTYKADLTKLDERLSRILERYTRQFSVMESIVGSNNSLKTSLKSSFDGMMASYTNK